MNRIFGNEDSINMSKPKLIMAMATLAALVMAMLIISSTSAATTSGFDKGPVDPPVGSNKIHLKEIGAYAGSGSEIAAFDAASERLFVVTGGAIVEVLDISDPSLPTAAFDIDVSSVGGNTGEGANSVSVYDGLVAIAVENTDKQANGYVAFYDTDGNFLNEVIAGALPDNLTFTPDGNKVVVANEGEPNDDYTVDPEGSVSIVDVSGGAAAATVTSVSFAEFNAGGPRHDELDPGIRIYGPNATVAQDLEPEYSTISGDSSVAYTTLQENNALAVIDLDNGEVIELVALGLIDRSHRQNAMDASNEDGGINIDRWPVWGMFQPDAISSYVTRGDMFLITANEGDSRDYDGFSEEERVKDLVLDPESFPNADYLQEEANLGRLKITTANGDADGDGVFEELYAYGGRSFSIWSTDGELVYDSGRDFERITAQLSPDTFNSQGDAASFDSRSDDKGPEAEGVTVGQINGRTFAFIGLERIGGVMVYDVTNQHNPKFIQYIPPAEGDISPEGLVFIPDYESPSGEFLLVVSYEVSGTTVIFEIEPQAPPRR